MATSTTAPGKGAGTYLYVFHDNSVPSAEDYTSDTNWVRLAKIKELTPGEMTAESEADDYLDDENADWTNSIQGQKSAGTTTFTLAWMPGDSGQKSLMTWWDTGEVRYYRIRYPNNASDIFIGWVSSLGKAVTSSEIITRSVAVTNSGKPLLPETGKTGASLTGLELDKTMISMSVGEEQEVNVIFIPSDAGNQGYSLGQSNPAKASLSKDGNVITVTGLEAGDTTMTVISHDGNMAAMASITVTA